MELNGISQILGCSCLYSTLLPTSNSKHLRRADSDASPLQTLTIKHETTMWNISHISFSIPHASPTPHPHPLTCPVSGHSPGSPGKWLCCTNHTLGPEHPSKQNEAARQNHTVHHERLFKWSIVTTVYGYFKCPILIKTLVDIVWL